MSSFSNLFLSSFESGSPSNKKFIVQVNLSKKNLPQLEDPRLSRTSNQEQRNLRHEKIRLNSFEFSNSIATWDITKTIIATCFMMALSPSIKEPF